jgi:ankyrin repeat protein
LGKLDGVKALLDQGVDINAVNFGNGTALVTAIWLGKTEVAKYLIARGADINLVDKCSGSYTPLGMAARIGNVEVVRLLLNKGADLSKGQIVVNGMPRTPLMIVNDALTKGFPSAFKPGTLEQVYTPLPAEERPRYEEVVRLLKAAGAK